MQIHLADFRGKYSPEGLDVRELRAIWYNLPQWDEHSTNPLEVSKAEWRSGFKSRMDNQVYKMAAGNLSEALKVNPVYEVSPLNCRVIYCCGFSAAYLMRCVHTVDFASVVVLVSRIQLRWSSAELCVLVVCCSGVRVEARVRSHRDPADPL